MAAHTQIGGVVVDAFQWKGGLLGNYVLPAWAAALSMQTPGDGTLHIPTRRGTVRVNPDDIAGALREIEKWRDHPRVVQPLAHGRTIGIGGTLRS